MVFRLEAWTVKSPYVGAMYCRERLWRPRGAIHGATSELPSAEAMFA